MTDKHPKDTALQTWATQVHGVYERACRAQRLRPALQRPAVQRQCEADLLARCQPYLEADAASVPQAVLCRRIQKYLPELFTFVLDPALSSTNNAAERSVRPVASTALCRHVLSAATRPPACCARSHSALGARVAPGWRPPGATRGAAGQPRYAPAGSAGVR